MCAFLFISSACSDEINKKYCNNFIKYLHEVHNLDIDVLEDEKYYVVLPLQGCESCIFSIISEIKELDESKTENFVYIYVGKYLGKGLFITNFLEENKKENDVLYDEFQKIFSYETGFAYPLLVKIKKGKCEIYEEISNTRCHSVFESIFLER